MMRWLSLGLALSLAACSGAPNEGEETTVGASDPDEQSSELAVARHRSVALESGLVRAKDQCAQLARTETAFPCPTVEQYRFNGALDTRAIDRFETRLGLQLEGSEDPNGAKSFLTDVLNWHLQDVHDEAFADKFKTVFNTYFTMFDRVQGRGRIYLGYDKRREAPNFLWLVVDEKDRKATLISFGDASD